MHITHFDKDVCHLQKLPQTDRYHDKVAEQKQLLQK